MTMHMIQGVNTLNNRKRKPKMTKGNMQRWSQEMTQYNKRARQTGEQQLTLDQYIDYAHGRGLPKKTTRKFEELKSTLPSTYRSTSHIPSRMEMGNTDSCALKESPKYTGTLIKGIATMHKSNAVPIIDDQQAKDISSMRR